MTPSSEVNERPKEPKDPKEPKEKFGEVALVKRDSPDVGTTVARHARPSAPTNVCDQPRHARYIYQSAVRSMRSRMMCVYT